MKGLSIFMSSLLLGASLSVLPAVACAQNVVGVTPGGIAVTEDTVVGWSVKKSLLGKAIYNEKEEQIGVINDLLIGMDSSISHVIVETSGENHRDVAIDAGAIQVHEGKFYIAGVSKEDVESVQKEEPKASPKAQPKADRKIEFASFI